MRLLLDTAVLVYALQAPERFSTTAANFLESLENLLLVSSVSLTEIAIKASVRKLHLNAAITQDILDALDIRVLPYTAQHAFKLFALPLLHSDPFDRQIIAQALAEEIPVVTSDATFRKYPGLQVIW